MADEIALDVKFNFAKAGAAALSFSRLLRIDVSGTHSYTNQQDVGTAAGGEALLVGADIATLGVCTIENTDDENYVELGVVVTATFYPSVKIKFGELWPFRMVPGVTYYVRANTASVKIITNVVED
jgi:hypothetical protein